jgi:hypothetical protein
MTDGRLNSVSAQLTNATKYEVTTSPMFALERNVDGEWVQWFGGHNGWQDIVIGFTFGQWYWFMVFNSDPYDVVPLANSFTADLSAGSYRITLRSFGLWKEDYRLQESVQSAWVEFTILP